MGILPNISAKELGFMRPQANLLTKPRPKVLVNILSNHLLAWLRDLVKAPIKSRLNLVKTPFRSMINAATNHLAGSLDKDLHFSEASTKALG